VVLIFKIKNITRLIKKTVKILFWPIGWMCYLKLKIQLLLARRPTVKPAANRRLSRVLMINMNDIAGGAAKVAFRLREELKKSGYQASMLVANKTLISREIETLPSRKSFFQRLLNGFQLKQSWLDFFHLSTFKIKKLECFKQSDVVHLHNLHGDYFTPFALPEISKLKPLVWTLHDMQAFTGHCAHSFDCDKWQTDCEICPYLSTYPAITKDTAQFLWQTKKNIYEKCALNIVCPSNWLKQKVEKSILKNQKIRLIYNGIDETVFSPVSKDDVRRKLKLPLGKTILMFSSHGGKANSWKGGEFLDKSYEHFKHNKDLVFLNVGAAKTQMNDNWYDIEYVENEKKLAEYYSAADVFIYPSLADNCPLVVLEALSCELPVVAFNTGGIPELVKHLQTGYIAKYRDLEDFIKGINLMISDKEFLATAAKEARQDVLQNFTLKKMAEKYLELYTNVL
jgi:glycosyltransferase involved in cell wall biosynthesis